MEVEMKKKTISFALVAILILVAGAFTVSPAFAANPSDTAGHWAEGQILAGINYGYINGYPDGTFKPEGTITRAEFVTIINKSRNYTTMTNIPFTDVPPQEWYFQEVQRAYSAGYIQGAGDNKFNPNAQITRQEVAVILDRIAPGGNTSFELTGVRDADKIESWALPAVRAAYGSAYITGDAEGFFNPTNPLKRGEAVTIVNRVLGIPPLTPGTNLAALSISNISVGDIQTDRATLNITATRDGTVYWVVLTDSDATTPTAEQVLGGRAADNRSAYSTGSRSVYANSAITAPLSSLQSEQSYKICAVARDAVANASPVAVYTFTTLNVGDTGEEWLNNNFTVSDLANNSITLTVNSSRTGTLYYVVVEDPNRNVKTPPQNYIKNGRDANNSSTNVISGNLSVSSGSPRSKDITGLKGGTNYKIFGCVYESSSSNSLYSKVKSAVFTTTGSNVDWIATFEASSVSVTNVTLNVRTNRTGTLYYVVTETASPPIATQIRDGLDKNNYNSLVSSYSYNIASTGTTYPISMTPRSAGLTSNRTYYVHGVLYVNGEWSEIETKSFTTAETGPLSSVSSRISTQGAIQSTIYFTGSGYNYSATSDVYLTGTNSGADVTLTVNKINNSFAEASIPSGVAETTNSVNFTIYYNRLTVGRNSVIIYVTESGRTWYYTVYINK
jgi:hypothetical protein